MNSPIRIKICGITRVEDALVAESVGVNALGFVFVEKSKRHIQVEQARAISRSLGAFVTRVGLFLNAPEKEVANVLEAMPELIPQFHGTESSDYCESFGRPYIKAIGLADGMPAESVLNAYANAAGLLFDSNAGGELGGTGHTFDWRILREYSGNRLILAGGLTIDNIENALAVVKPDAIDLSTGVEVSPGIKDHVKTKRFVEIARRASTPEICDSAGVNNG